jgi:hypothetical protein
MASGIRRTGVHVVSSGDAVYPDVISMLQNGDAWLVGERYDENAKHHVAVAVGLARPNGDVGHIRIGQDYYSSVLRDYRDWKERWWREAIQNAVDAGSSRIGCFVRKQDDESILVSCSDNGRGMDRDTILEKFLVLGGTTKRSMSPTGESTAGGFGKAKELLLLPWIAWSIRSRDVIVEGQGGTYEVREPRYPEGDIDGTQIAARMPADRCTGLPEALAYIGKCNLSGVVFEMDGEDAPENRIVRAALRTGKEVREFGEKATLYQNKSATFRGLMLVRVKGLNMFTRRVSEAVQGTLILELRRPSIELLTANRDSFSDEAFGWEVDRFVNELAADVKSALRSKKGVIRQVYRGTGLFTADEQQAAAARANRALGILWSEAGGKAFTMGSAQAEAVAGEMSLDEGPVDEMELSLAPNVGAVRAMLDGLKVNGTLHAEAVAKQASWKPDFYVYVDDDAEGFRVSSKFLPGKMAPSNVKLARFWAELCRFVLIQLGSESSYGVGWVFSNESAAAFSRDEGARWLLLNPFRGSKLGGELLSLGNKDDVAWLYAAAIHECTHMADEVSYHDESFSSAMTRNVAKCANKWRQVEAIRKAVVARRKEHVAALPADVEPEKRECPFYFGAVSYFEIVPLSIILATVDAAPKHKTAEQITSQIHGQWGISFGVGAETPQDFVEDALRLLVRMGYVVVDDLDRYSSTECGIDALIWLDNRPIDVPPDLTAAAHGVMGSLAMIVHSERLSEFLERYPGQDELIRKALGVLSQNGLVELEVDLQGDSAEPKNWWVRAHLSRDSAIRVARWFL